jgi:hypothetical protein
LRQRVPSSEPFQTTTLGAPGLDDLAASRFPSCNPIVRVVDVVRVYPVPDGGKHRNRAMSCSTKRQLRWTDRPSGLARLSEFWSTGG